MQNLFGILRFSSLKGRLRLMAGAIVVTICLLAILFITLFGKMIKEQEIYASLQKSLDMQLLFLDKWKAERMSDVLYLAGVPAARSMDIYEMGDVFRQFRASSLLDFDTISMANKDGKLILSMQEPVDANIVDREYFRLVRNNEIVVSDVITGRLTGKSVLAFSAPVRDGNGAFAGAVIGTIDVQTLDAIVNEFKFGDGGETFLMSKEGRRFTKGREEFAAERIRDQHETEIFKRAVAGAQNKKPYVNSVGDKVFGSYAWSSDRQWLLVGEIRTRDIYKPYYRLLAVMAVISALLLLVGYFEATLFARKMSDLLQHLLNGTKRIREGEFGYRIDPAVIRSAPAELQELSNNFNIMSDKLQATVQLLEKTAVIDHLTEVYNRRFLLNEGAKIEEAAARAGNASCILLVDIDNFKKINDTYGHLIGDRVLKHAAGLLVASVRNSDVAARYGGEEFVILATNCELAQGRELAERIRGCFAQSPYRDEELLIALTASIGVAQSCPKRKYGTNTLEDMIERADKALYRAKNRGRNRVECDDTEVGPDEGE